MGRRSKLCLGERIALYAEARAGFRDQWEPVHLFAEQVVGREQHLICRRTARLRVRRGLPLGRMPVAELSRGTPGGCLAIPGCGTYSPFGHEGLPQATLRASEIFKDVVILPSRFDISVQIVADALARESVSEVAAALTSTPVRYLDAWDQKLSRQLSFIVCDEEDHLASSAQVDWLLSHDYVVAVCE